MKRRGPSLWIAKWVALLTCVAAAGWWGWVLVRHAEPQYWSTWSSPKWSAGWRRTAEVRLSKRGVDFWSETSAVTDPHLPPYLWKIGSRNYRPYLLPSLETGARHTWLHVPPWLILALLVLPTALLWRLDHRRPQPGRCHCGYNLTGNTSGRCPECGRVAKAREPAE